VGTGQWYANSGLIDAEQPGAQPDWGIGFNANGQVAGGLGNPDITAISQLNGLGNGNAHVVVYSRSGSTISLTVDGASTVLGGGATDARGAFRVLMGSLNGGNYFNGDIAEVQMFTSAVSGANLDVLGASLASKYALATSFSGQGYVPDGSPVSLTASGTSFDLNGNTETIGSLAGVAGSTVSLGSGLLTTGGNNTSTNFAGVISGAGGLIKIGNGTMTLSGANSYTGATNVDAGTLLITGSIAGSAVTVESSGTIGGTGTITTGNQPFTLAAGGKIAPGTSAGNLTIDAGTSSLDLTAGISSGTGALVFELGAVGASDKVTLSLGTLTIGADKLDFSDFAFSALPGFGEGTYTLFDANSPISGSLGAISGTIAGFSATLGIDNVNNDIVLNVVPEPNSAALLGIAGTVLGFRRRRKK
jgi:autotransporter-associated beta strand protein